MKNGHRILIKLGILWLGLQPGAKADLIATFNSTDIGQGGVGVFSTVNFTISGGSPGSEIFPVFDTLALGNSDAGQSFYVSSNADDPDFDGLSAYLTDGIDQNIAFLSSMPAGTPGGGVFGPQSNFITTSPGPDATGYTIDYFELVVNSLSINSPGDNPNGDGNWTTASYNFTFNIYGTAVPEPSTLVLFGASLAYSLVRRTRSGTRSSGHRHG